MGSHAWDEDIQAYAWTAISTLRMYKSLTEEEKLSACTSGFRAVERFPHDVRIQINALHVVFDLRKTGTPVPLGGA